MTVTEFIRTHNTLADKGFVNWTDPAFHRTLKGTVGQRFFHHMANLNIEYLDDLVTASREQKVQYLDYGTECKLRRLLDKEKGDKGDIGSNSWAKEHLQLHREFYKKWERELFGDHVFQVPGPTQAKGQNGESQTATADKSASRPLRCNMYAIFLGIIIYMAAIY